MARMVRSGRRRRGGGRQPREFEAVSPPHPSPAPPPAPARREPQPSLAVTAVFSEADEYADNGQRFDVERERVRNSWLFSPYDRNVGLYTAQRTGSRASSSQGIQRGVALQERPTIPARMSSLMDRQASAQSVLTIQLPNTFAQDREEARDSRRTGVRATVPRVVSATRSAPLLSAARPASSTMEANLSLCRYFAAGYCRYGRQCMYSHELHSRSGSSRAVSESARGGSIPATRICPYFQEGSCKYGDRCRLHHGRPASSAQIAPPSTATGANSRTVNDNRGNAVSVQDAATCGICFDDIVQSDKLFGLLKCDHCFCFDCLASWRNSADMNREVSRSCPVCREPSDVLVPSASFCKGAVKKKLLEAFRASVADMELQRYDEDEEILCLQDEAYRYWYESE